MPFCGRSCLWALVSDQVISDAEILQRKQREADQRQEQNLRRVAKGRTMSQADRKMVVKQADVAREKQAISHAAWSYLTEWAKGTLPRHPRPDARPNCLHWRAWTVSRPGNGCLARVCGAQQHDFGWPSVYWIMKCQLFGCAESEL